MKQKTSTAKQKPNNNDWKRTLQDVIDRHNSQHARKRNTVGNRTMDQHASTLFRIFTTLRNLGFKFSHSTWADVTSKSSFATGRQIPRCSLS